MGKSTRATARIRDAMMKPVFFFSTIIAGLAAAFQDPLSYRSLKPTYTLPKPDNVTTLLDIIDSRPDLSRLRAALTQSGGFEEAFGTTPTWDFTFFAPNNDAFAHTGRYFSTFESTPYVFTIYIYTPPLR
jgi:uncharacterized surface protein with fasciclin (FAS1) repeats